MADFQGWFLGFLGGAGPFVWVFLWAQRMGTMDLQQPLPLRRPRRHAARSDVAVCAAARAAVLLVVVVVAVLLELRRGGGPPAQEGPSRRPSR